MFEIAGLMRTFVTVADLQSFSRAAETLAVNQSSISRQVHALERHLGVTLLHRTTRSLSLTLEGSTFYDSAQHALAAIDEAESSVRHPDELTGTVRLTAPLTFARAKIIPFIVDFQRMHPKLQVDLKLSDHALNLVADHLDFALRVGQVGDSRNKIRKVGVAKRVLVASPDYLAKQGHPRSPVELARHNCLSFTQLSTGSTWHFRNHSPVQIHANFRSDTSDAVRTAALCGAGIAANARWLFEDDLAAGRLLEVLPDYPPVDLAISMVMPPVPYVATRVRLLADYLVNRIRADPLLMPE